jgi:site-specific DNA-methyltransferase (adenine-specific)
MRYTENISVFYEKQPIYNPQKTNGHKPSTKSSNKSQKQTDVYGKFEKQEKGGQTDRFPKNILKFDNVNSLHNVVHPTQNPVALMEYLIKTYTNEGELVLDFTVGSGTTMVACRNTNRKGIGIELDENYFKIATERVNNV